MRTFSAEAQAAMDSSDFEAYLRAGFSDVDPDQPEEWIQPVYFKLEDVNVEITVPRLGTNYAFEGSYVVLKRGVIISGVPETTTTSSFYITEASQNERYIFVKGVLLRPNYKTLAANLTYREVIERIYYDELNPTHYIIKPTYEFPLDDVWGYQFFPTGKRVVINNLVNLYGLLRQKYLIYARHTENTFDASTYKIDIYFYQPTKTRAIDYIITDLLFTKPSGSARRRFLWRDDENTVNIYNAPTNGSALYPLHNLGYIPTGGTHPDYAPSVINGISSKLPCNLKYESGDYVTIVTSSGSFNTRIKVTEVFDTKSTPVWYMVVEPLKWFQTTEGGALPSTIEASAPYTPLNTSHFNKNLDATVNNLQALAEAVDELNIGGTIAWDDVTGAVEGAQDAVGAMIADTATIQLTYTDATPELKANVKAASITEAMQSLADNTTNDVSTARHGYVPKAPNDASKFLNGMGAWGPAGGGDWVLIADVTLADVSASIIFSSIPSIYKHLWLTISGRSTSPGVVDSVRIQFNADTGSNYDVQYLYSRGTSVVAGASIGSPPFSGVLPGASVTRRLILATTDISIPNYTATAFEKSFYACSGFADSVASNSYVWTSIGSWRNTNAITAVRFFCSYDLMVGTRATLYGKK